MVFNAIVLFTDGSGKYPPQPDSRRCVCGIAGEATTLAAGSQCTRPSCTPYPSLARCSGAMAVLSLTDQTGC
eukprot:6394807-Amphidinium_carterae.1